MSWGGDGERSSGVRRSWWWFNRVMKGGSCWGGGGYRCGQNVALEPGDWIRQAPGLEQGTQDI